MEVSFSWCTSALQPHFFQLCSMMEAGSLASAVGAITPWKLANTADQGSFFFFFFSGKLVVNHSAAHHYS